MRRLQTILASILLVLSITNLSAATAQVPLRKEGIDPSLLNYLSSPLVTTISPTVGSTTQATAGTDVQVTFDPANTPQNEPSITADPLNASILAAGANDYRLAAQGLDAWSGLYVSKDAGKTWTNSLLPGYPGGPVSALTGFGVASDPALAFDGEGNLYYAGIAFDRTANGGAKDGTVFVAKSTDTGTSFQTVVVARGSSSIFNDKSYIAVDTNTTSPFAGRIYVSWTQFRTTTGKILFSLSTDNGATFSSSKILSDSSVNQGSVPAVGPGGIVYVAWRDITNNRIKTARSDDGGASFTAPVTVASVVPLPNTLPNTSFRTNTNPTVAVDPASGNVYVAWNDYGKGNADILLSRSEDRARTFSPPLRINDDTGNKDQFFPWLATTSGRVSAVFYDRRLDQADHNMDVFYTDSTNGAVSFSQNLRITDLSINPDIQFQGQFIGDYIGLTVTGLDAYPVWMDTRNQNQDIFTDRIVLVKTHDLVTTTISVPRTIGYTLIPSNPLNVQVTIQNRGNVAENATVQLSFANGPVQANQTVTISPSTSQTVVLKLATQNLAKGNYTITAGIVPVPGETNTTNNMLTDGTVVVRFPGDVNGDGLVNILDAARLAFFFDKTCGTIGYQDSLDLNNDCRIDIVDASTLAFYYGTIDP